MQYSNPKDLSVKHENTTSYLGKELNLNDEYREHATLGKEYKTQNMKKAIKERK